MPNIAEKNKKLTLLQRQELVYNGKIITNIAREHVQRTGFFADEKISSDKGTLFMFQILTDDSIKVLSNAFGTVDYKKGEIIIDTVNITSTALTNNIIEVEATPDSNDVLARNELYLQFDVSKSNFYMRKDSIASGANTSGSRYNPQSSYQIGKRTR